jgi:hypothetical protein
VNCPRGYLTEKSCYFCAWWKWQESACFHPAMNSQLQLFGVMKKAKGVEYARNPENKKVS